MWGAVSSDGTRVFIVNQGSNNVSVIDTATDTVINTLPVGAGPNYITYQATLNRAYVTSPAGNSLSIINNNLGTVQTISLAGAPCNGQHPISVTALADGSRVYVADDVTNSVCVLNTTNNTFTKSIPGRARRRFSSPPIATPPAYYTANSGSHDVSIIQTSDGYAGDAGDTDPLTVLAGHPLTNRRGATPAYARVHCHDSLRPLVQCFSAARCHLGTWLPIPLTQIEIRG